MIFLKITFVNITTNLISKVLKVFGILGTAAAALETDTDFPKHLIFSWDLKVYH